MSDCLFCKIVAGDIPAEKVAETDHSFAFRDVNPQAPTHILVVPKRHVPDVTELAATSADETADLIALAKQVSGGEDFRLVFNNGPGAQQTVFHAHAHVLAGRDFAWPPG